LDAGGGDGLRTEKISSLLKPNYTILIDSAPEMIALAKLRSIDDVFCKKITEFKSDIRFNLITSLWNVLGHMDTKKERIKSLINLKKHLSRNGVLIFDVNNRYNLNYGLKNVIFNMINDLMPRYEKKNGWYTFQYKNNNFPVYLHSPFELIETLKSSGFSNIKIFSVDYSTGKVYNNYFMGQLFVVAKKN